MFVGNMKLSVLQQRLWVEQVRILVGKEYCSFVTSSFLPTVCSTCHEGEKPPSLDSPPKSLKRPKRKKNKIQMETLKEYLTAKGLLNEPNPKKLEAAKEEYYKQYRKKYDSEYKKQFKRVELLLTTSEYRKLRKEAFEHHQKIRPFLKSCVFAYIDESFILPDDEKLRKLRLELLRIGTNINQLVRFVNRTVYIDNDQIGSLSQYLKEIDQKVCTALQQPTNLKEWLGDFLKQNPDNLQKLKILVSQFEAQQEAI